MKVWFAILGLLCGLAAAEPPQPSVLYHWASFNNLKRVAALNRGKDGYPVDTIWDAQWLSISYPELVGKPGIYAWTNPATGMAADLTEIYGGQALVKIRLKPGLKTVELVSREGEKGQPLPERAKGAQLILHKRYNKDGRLYYQEWVLLDPHAVEGYSALPDASRAEVEREVAHLESPTFRYADDTLHYLDPDGEGKSQSVFNQQEPRKILLNKLRLFLKADLRRISPRFRRDVNAPLGKCEAQYSGVGGGE